MADTLLPLERPLSLELGLAFTRAAQSSPARSVPAGLQVISADNHVEVTEDIFYRNFPARLKDRAPRVWFDGYWRMGIPGQMEAWDTKANLDDLAIKINAPNGFDEATRMADLKIEGIVAEVAFPQSLFGFLRHKDLEVRQQMYDVYNVYMAEIGKRNAGRFFGVGVFRNWWDPQQAEASMQQIVDLGLKTFMTPTLLKDENGQEVSFASERMDAFWSSVEDSGLPLSLHIGEDPAFGARGAHAAYFLSTTSPFRKALAQLMFGGVFDRHPKLQIVFTEAGINWVAAFLQDAELYFGTYCDLAGNRPKLSPTEYWRKHCYATFQWDKIGLEMLEYIGADRVMWGADYPHSEGSFGYSWTARQEVVNCCSEQQARMILGDTASALYRLQVEC